MASLEKQPDSEQLEIPLNDLVRILTASGTKGQKPVKPTGAERLSNWDNQTETALKIWYRFYALLTSSIGLITLIVIVSGLLFGWPMNSNESTKIIELIFSSGKGFTVPAILLGIYGFKALDRFFKQRITKIGESISSS